MRLSFLLFGLVVAGLIIVALQWWPTDAPPPEVVTPPSVAEPESPATSAPPVQPSAPDPLPEPLPVEPAVVLPPLAESDPFVLAQIEPWALPPSWLEREDLLARVAVTIQNAADGSVPRSQLRFLAPAEGFKVRKVGQQLLVDPASYQRFDPLLDVLESVSAEQTSAFVRQVSPLLDAALAQLGERRSVDELLRAATRRIETTPELPAQVALEQPHVVYVYADERLEQLPEFEKQLLRLGPNNLARLKTYVARFRAAYLEP